MIKLENLQFTIPNGKAASQSVWTAVLTGAKGIRLKVNREFYVGWGSKQMITV